MKIGDIYLVDLPQIGGREQMGKRPAIILFYFLVARDILGDTTSATISQSR